MDRRGLESRAPHWERWPELETGISNLISTVPKYRYNGDMYRGLSLPLNTFNKHTDIRLVLTNLQKFEMENGDNSMSWSKSLNGMYIALTNNMDSNENVYGPCFYVIKQHTVGLDTFPIVQDYPQYDIDKVAVLLGDEQEVLAKIDNSVHLHGFILDDKFYTAEQFQTFVNQIKQKNS